MPGFAGLFRFLRVITSAYRVSAQLSSARNVSRSPKKPRGHAERSRLGRLVRTCSALWCAQRPTRPLRIAQAERSPLDQCWGRGGSEPRGCEAPVCAYGRSYRRSPHPTLRKTPLHVPAIGARIREGLSNMLDARTIPERVACSPLSTTTCLPDRLTSLVPTQQAWHGWQAPTHPIPSYTGEMVVTYPHIFVGDWEAQQVWSARARQAPLRPRGAVIP